MAIKHVVSDDKEPEESNFKLPAEKEHLFQVVDYTENENDSNILSVKLEIVGGDDNGISILQRTNIDETLKSFYFARLFLKAIGEPYKGIFDIDPDRWVGRQFYATVKHTAHKGKTYANIDQYNFDKKVEQTYKAPGQTVTDPKDIAWED